MTIKEFFSFRSNRYLWGNLLAMVAVVVILLFATLKGLDNYTRHGEAILVPDVTGMDATEAAKIFASKGLECAVSDSTYVKEMRPGCILDQRPAANHKVKEGRLIYLTINTLSTPLVIVPDVADNSSLRQAEARLIAAGFKLTPHDTIPGEKDWVYGVKYNDQLLTTGEKVPTGATLTLSIGDGGLLELENDSLTTDTEGIETSVESSATEESWF